MLFIADADRGSITGTLQYRLPDIGVYLEFRYQVVRLWEKPVEDVLAGGLGTLPLAPLADVTEEELPDVIARMKTRIDEEATPEQAGKLWTATNVPVQYLEWQGSCHMFEISSQAYALVFMAANQKKLVNVRPEVWQWLSANGYSVPLQQAQSPKRHIS